MDGTRKMLAFFETNEAKRLAMETPGTFNFQPFVFVAHSTPKLGFKTRKQKKTVSERPNKPSKNEKTNASSNANQKTSASGHKGHATNQEKDKEKSQKKDKKKSKRSSGSSKSRDKDKVLAKITKLLGQLIN